MWLRFSDKVVEFVVLFEFLCDVVDFMFMDDVCSLDQDMFVIVLLCFDGVMMCVESFVLKFVDCVECVEMEIGVSVCVDFDWV